ncbi:MAG: DNA polymerase I [Nitrospirae bacterium]|nr:DNA polymerase I [Candidatus Troglogloeales bacterium]
MSSVKSFYIIDGSSYIFRAYFAIRELSNSKGLPTNAVYGFMKMIMKIVNEMSPDYLAIVFDAKGPTFRHTAYKEYKAHRPPMPEPLSIQIPYIHRAVSAFGIFSTLREGYEADDLIGTLAKKGEAQGLNVMIVSGDKDMFQLISPHITIYDTLKEKRFTEVEIRARFGVAPPQIVEIMGLMGDTADNIPGVAGVGEKTAIDLVGQWGTIENLLLNLNQVKRPKLREALEKEKEIARLSRSLATIDINCPIDFNLETYKISPPDMDALVPLLQELEFSSLLKEMRENDVRFPVEPFGNDKNAHDDSVRVERATPEMMIADYLLNPTKRDHSLTESKEQQLLLLAERGLSSLFFDIEIPLMAVLSEIEQSGVKINVPLLKSMSADLQTTLVELTKKIYALAGREFNINSPKQLGQILFDELHLTPLRKTKTGFSTDEEVLTHLSIQHELPAEILNYRQGVKLKSTYVDVLPNLVDQEDRVHTKLNQTVAATGRLSSTDPNLQNIPVVGEWGRRIRQAFIVEEGSLLLTADYNQIELRILAHLSNDPALINAFKTGEDIHVKTAAEIFALPKDVITKEMRRVGKTVNFGIIYGISPFGLAANLGISQKEAKRYIDLYFAHYHGVKAFIEKTVRGAEKMGYVTTLFNRRREIPELSSGNRKVREIGERLAVNTPIQGSAADIIKLSMIAIAKWMKERGVKSRMILQVHDELLFEIPDGEIFFMQEKVTSLMEEVIWLSVPLKVDLGIGLNWWAAKQQL